LTQYKAILKDEEVQERFGDLESFQREYNVSFTSATYRLKVGVPATVEHAGSHHISSSSDTVTDQVNARHIAETVEVPTLPPFLRLVLLTEGKKFITFMDALKLNYKSKDQLHPLLSDLMTSLNTSMPKDFEARGKIVQWLITLNQMRAADELNEDQSRQVQTDCLCGADGRFCLILRRHIISFSMRLGSSMACIRYSFIPSIQIYGCSDSISSPRDSVKYRARNQKGRGMDWRVFETAFGSIKI
jgi:VPS28 protein